MKKYLYLLILVLMLGACNMPINPTPTADLVSTAVSGTLTSAPTNTIAVPTETQPPVPTQAITPTSTETPTLTPTFTNTPNADCLLYTSPSPRDRTRSRMPSSA